MRRALPSYGLKGRRRDVGDSILAMRLSVSGRPLSESCLLAIETTGSACSVALARGDELCESTRIAERSHNALVLGMIDELFAVAGLRPAQLDAVAFSAGPGSFTGVRIGAAVAQSIALGADIGVTRVPTSELMAEQIRRRCAADGVVTARRSRRGWHYVARYRFDARGVACEAFDALAADAEPLDAPDGWIIAEREERLRAGVLAELARPRPAADAAVATPYYVEGDSPWRKMQ